MNKLYYASQVDDKSIINKSGSGGMFCSIATFILNKNGIVYGASFSSNFEEVNIERVDNINDLDKLLTSKYMMSNVRDSFRLVKEDLENNRIVLFSGLPCQIYGLKNYLKKDYDNLFCCELVCHGALPNNIWKDYLESIRDKSKDIVSINMRDKRLGWYDYGMSIKYNDGSEFFENHKDNKYMKVFLCDKYLNKSCYSCKFKNENSKADITIGDYWGLVKSKLTLDRKLGTNVVIVNTQKGLELFNSLSNIIKYEIKKEDTLVYNAGMSNDIKTTPSNYERRVFAKSNVAILTLNFNDNIGGVLQSYALQKFLSDNYYDATTIQSHEYWHHLSFVKKLKCRVVNDFSKIQNDYSSYIVGSDQVWRRDFISGKWRDSWQTWKPLFLDFAKNWNVNKIAYSASYGNDNFNFNDVMPSIKDCLNSFDAISMRELDATKYIDSITNTPTTNTCDPTMLLTKEDYIKLCSNIKTKENGLFTYILDKSDEKTKIANKILSNLSIEKVSRVENNVEEWLASYRDSKCVLTDSFHGVVFSIIFNKPFICIYNKSRGGSRFNTLIELFNIGNRVVTSEDEIDYSLLEIAPNIDYTKFVEYSKNYLLSNLSKKKERKEIKMSTSKTSPVFGIVSWLPSEEPNRTQRVERLNKMLQQLVDIFGEDIHFMFVAQNWKDYQLPSFIKNAHVFRYDKLGILGARKTLGKHFLESRYDYLIMCDDDLILETSDFFSRDYFFEELNKHPQGFVFLRYGWSLTFCAVSKYIYSQTPMVDIDPEKGEGYEDTVWPWLLHYKHPSNEFTLSGIKFVQHEAKYHKDHKSTWDSKNVNHALLNELTQYYKERFKSGKFTIDKEKAKKYLAAVKYVEKARWYGWLKEFEIKDFLDKYKD